MKKRNTTAPLKAYRVGFYGESAGTYVGRTAGQAKAAAIRDYEGGGHERGLWRTVRALRVRNPEKEALEIEAFEDKGKYWRNTRAYARLQAEADAFNALWPVGTPVQVVECGEASQWPDGITVTRTPAWAVQGSVLVSVEGQAGGMYLKYVMPLLEPVTV